MKHSIFTLILLSVSSLAFSQDNAGTIAAQSYPVATIPDSITKKLAENNELITSLTNENIVLKKWLKESQDETQKKEAEIARLQRQIQDLKEGEIKRLEASKDSMQRSLINVASNFMYLPYEEYSINEIAIPAFTLTKGSTFYQHHQNIFDILQNYKSDIISLNNFLATAEAELKKTADFGNLRADKGKDHLDKLSALPLYARYTSYNDWTNTYLGAKIIEIQKYLKAPAVGIEEKLKAVRTSLEPLVK